MCKYILHFSIIFFIQFSKSFSSILFDLEEILGTIMS